MSPFSAPIRRHALRAALLLAAVLVWAACPPVFANGLPGPGLWPSVTAAGLFCGACLLPSPQKTEKMDGRRRHEARMMMFSGMLWIVLLVPAGCFVATFLAGLCACRSAGCSLKESLLLPALLCLLLQVGVVHLLQWPLPTGILPAMLSAN